MVMKSLTSMKVGERADLLLSYKGMAHLERRRFKSRLYESLSSRVADRIWEYVNGDAEIKDVVKNNIKRRK